MYSLAPKGKPTERLIILALRWNNRGYTRLDYDEGLTEREIFDLIGGTLRSMESAMRSLKKRKIIRRVMDESRGWIYLFEGGFAAQDLISEPRPNVQSSGVWADD